MVNHHYFYVLGWHEEASKIGVGIGGGRDGARVASSEATTTNKTILDDKASLRVPPLLQVVLLMAVLKGDS